MNVLQQILTSKRAEIAERKKAGRPPVHPSTAPSFVDALRSAPMGLVAEVKHKSPSAGVIRDPFDAAAIARAYERAGANAISVLLDEKYFGGGEKDFQAVRRSVKLPLLYKEFVVDEWQVWHAASLGASAALLIVAALTDEELKKLLRACADANLAALVEVHDEEETRRALNAGAACIGVNNRDLKTLSVSLETTFRLRKLVPSSTLLVGESGIQSPDDVLRLKQAGVDAVLVGESLLRQPDVEKAVHDLMSKV